MTASIPVLPNMDVVFIMEQCNQSSGEHGTAYVENGRLYCPDVSQDDLDAAVSVYVHKEHLAGQETRKIEKEANLEASKSIINIAPFYKQLNEATDVLSALGEAILGIQENLGITPTISEDPRVISGKVIREAIQQIRNKAQEKKNRPRNINRNR